MSGSGKTEESRTFRPAHFDRRIYSHLLAVGELAQVNTYVLHLTQTQLKSCGAREQLTHEEQAFSPLHDSAKLSLVDGLQRARGGLPLPVRPRDLGTRMILVVPSLVAPGNGSMRGEVTCALEGHFRRSSTLQVCLAVIQQATEGMRQNEVKVATLRYRYRPMCRNMAILGNVLSARNFQPLRHN